MPITKFYGGSDKPHVEVTFGAGDVAVKYFGQPGNASIFLGRRTGDTPADELLQAQSDVSLVFTTPQSVEAFMNILIKCKKALQK